MNRKMIPTGLWLVENNEMLLQEIGRVTVRWAEVDRLLVHLAAVSLNDNYEAAQHCIFGSSNSGIARLTAFEQIIGASKLDETERREIINISRDLRSLLGKRNEIVHSPLVHYFSVLEGRLSAELKQIDRTGGKKDVSPDKIRKHADKVGEKIESLAKIWWALDKRYRRDHSPEILPDETLGTPQPSPSE